MLALDIGTSSVRAGLYATDGTPVPGAAARVPHQVDYRLDGGVETDADALVARVEQAIDQCVAAAGDALPEVAAIGTSCFWHSLLGLDGALHPCTPLLIWADTRSAAMVSVLEGRLDAGAVRARTGCRPHSSYPPAKLLWIRRERPEWWAQARHWVSFGEYLTLRLCGVLAASVSMASASGLYDQTRGRWDEEVAAAAEVPLGALPELADLAELPDLRLTRRDRWPGLAAARVLLPAGDGACNNVGSGCMDPEAGLPRTVPGAQGGRPRVEGAHPLPALAAGSGLLALMIGTSGAVRRCSPGGPWTVAPSLWQYRLDRRRGLVGGALSNGGNLHQWLSATLRLPEGDLDAAIGAMPPAEHGLVFLPLLAGERSPGWAPGATGAIVGLREATSPLELLRAGLEAVALRFAALVADMGGAGQIVGSGGGLFHSPAWAQIVADAVGQDVWRSAEPEPSSRGAALLALEAAGILPDAADLPPRLDGVVRADAARHERYVRAGARQRRLYALLAADAEIGWAPAAGGA